ncbi:FAD-dependent oxidoreductase [Bacillus pacificus]
MTNHSDNFSRHRLGNEVVENLIEPSLSGIYAGDIDEMSLMSNIPAKCIKLSRNIAVFHSVCVRSLRKKRKAEPKKGIFKTVKTGLESIVESLEAKMHEGTIIKGTRIEKVAKQGDAYTITLSNGKEVEADAVVVAKFT